MSNKTESNKTEVVRLRVTPEEKAQILAEATALGLTFSAYVIFKLGLDIGDRIGKRISERHTDGEGNTYYDHLI